MEKFNLHFYSTAVARVASGTVVVVPAALSLPGYHTTTVHAKGSPRQLVALRREATSQQQRPGVSSQHPSIYPLRTCCIKETSVALGCLVKDYFPGSVAVTWDTVPLDGSTLTFPSIQMANSSLYVTTSQLTVSGEQPKQFTCSVFHAETNTTAMKTVSTECAKNFSDPSVRLFYSSCDPSGDTHTTIQLLCRISGYTPGKIKVTWLVDGHESKELYAQPGPEIQEGNLTTTYSEVNITQGQWVSEKTYTCRVNYYGFNFDNHARRCTAESEPRGVSTYLIPPTPLELYVNKSPKITCLVVDLASTNNLSLTWSRANGKPVHADPVDIKHQFNGTITVTSTLPVDVIDWVEGETYYCKVSHGDLPKDIQRSISKDVGKRVAPKVYVFWPDRKELENQEELTLTCLIQKFFPKDISVQWLRNKKPMREGQHTTTQPDRADNNSLAFFAYSRLAVPKASWKMDDEFTCQVIHEALPKTRTLEKSVFINSELALEDLCAEEAESEELEETWTSLLVFIVLFLLSVSYGATVSLCKEGDCENTESEASPSIFPLSLGNNDPAEQVVIGCLVQGFFPSAPLSVTWNQSGDNVSVRNFPAVLDGNQYTMSSQLTLPASLCPENKFVTCQVQHLSKASKTVDVPCKCKVCPEECLPSNCEPSLSLQPPALEDLLLSSNASLTCTLNGLKSAEGASFTWSPTGGKTAVQGSPKRDSCGCYSVSSVLPGCADPWNSGQTFSCSATYPDSESPLTTTIKKDLANTFRPQVHLLPPPSEELALNELVTLTCLVRGFSPRDVLVRWLQGNQELPREKYLTWGPLPEPGQSVATFAVTSVLRVDAEVWKQGDTFSCMVGHEALPLAFTQKTIDRLAEPQPWLVLDLMQGSPEEDSPEDSLWPTTVTLLTLFLLSLFYSTALTVTSIRATPDSREVPQY
ncbi:hypothetical protein AB1E19_015880 [Capra hircus]